MRFFKDKQYRWKLIRIFCTVTIIIPFIIQLLLNLLSGSIFKQGTSDGWLGFWGGYLGSIIGIIGIFVQFNNQLRHDQKVAVEKARPVFSLSYRARLNADEKLYVNTGAYFLENLTNENTVLYTSFLQQDAIKIGEKIRFKMPGLLCLANNSQRDALSCTINVQYIFGKEADKIGFDGKRYVDLNQEDLKKEMFSEHFEIASIDRKESSIIVVYPMAYHHFAHILDVQVYYSTEEREEMFAHFKSDKNGILSYIPTYESKKMTEKQNVSYTAFSQTDNDDKLQNDFEVSYVNKVGKNTKADEDKKIKSLL